MLSDQDVRIAEVFDDKKAIYSLVLDDGCVNDLVRLELLANKYRIRYTCAITVHNLKKFLWINKFINRRGNVEFINHSYSHLKMDNSEIEENVLIHEITEAKKITEDVFGKKLIAFVPPHNTLSNKAYKVVSENGYLAMRKGERGLNNISPDNGREPFQLMNLGTKGIRDVSSVEEQNKWVDDAISKRKWLIEMWHSVGRLAFKGYQNNSFLDSKKHLEYVHHKSEDLWIAPFQECIKFILEKQNSTLSVDDDMIVIHCNDLDPSVFDHKLTIVVNGEYIVRDELGNVVSTNNDTVTKFNAIPNRKYRVCSQ